MDAQEPKKTTECTETVDAPKKRGRKPDPDKKKGYFLEREEQAFKDYCMSTDQSFRDKVFRNVLYPAFTKMVESLIRTYGLQNPLESFEDTFHEAMSFLVTKAEKFDATKGTKAFSYCGTICKRHLLARRKKAQQEQERLLSYDQKFGGIDGDPRMADETSEVAFYEELVKNTVAEIEDVLNGECSDQLTPNEVRVGYALTNMLKNWDEIFVDVKHDKFNKTSMLFFIKEYTGLNTKDVRNAMKRYKELYYETKRKIIDGE